MEKIQNEVIDILKKYTFNPLALENFTLETKIISDLKINSARIVDIIIDIEEKYDITIEDDELENLICIKDIVEIIEKKSKV